MAINNIYSNGIASGWRVLDASQFSGHQVFEADVAIVGTGAGGGTAAEILSQAGLSVLMVEEGPLKTADSFKHMEEGAAYRELYFANGARPTKDGAIQIGQGRCVGGGTTVNTTSSFRTAPQTLKQWADVHGVRGASPEEMDPWFAKMEERLGISPWAMPPNANNATLRVACEKLGWEWHTIPRNVRGCVDSGYCMQGCPINAKQSMLVTTVPSALKQGAVLIHHLRAQRLQMLDGSVTAMDCHPINIEGVDPNGATVEVRARHYLLAAGGINTPALLMRSGAPDPYRRLGLRTMLHPHLFTMAEMPDKVEGYFGAPQSIASDEFQWVNPPADGAAFKLEVAPNFPISFANILDTHGPELADAMRRLPNMQSMMALMRDGFHDYSRGGRVAITQLRSAVLDYRISDYLGRGMRQALLHMAEAQFAAGARRVRAAHLDSHWHSSWAQAKAEIEQLPMKPNRLRMVSVHVMGGCAMGEDPRQSVTNSLGRHHQIENLSVMDGSLFPTSIGANPQLSIYGLVAKNATALASELARPA